MNTPDHHKTAQTTYPVTDLIRNRWSPRSFSARELSDEAMLTILEGGNWAPSANNSQPWRQVYALRGTRGFDAIVSVLAAGNQPWARLAAALVVTVGVRELPDSQQKNAYYLHDAGMYNAFMLLQAQSMEVSGHVMAGFDKHKMAELLDLPVSEEAVTVTALGYRDEAEKLEEPYRTRELSKRSRKTLTETATAFSI